MTIATDSARFETGAAKYAAYLETPEGRLRLDLAFATLRDFLPPTSQNMRALDLGGGTGAMAVRLAALGIHVTLLDASSQMLEFAGRLARQEKVSDRVALQQGDAAELAKLFKAESFDLVLCHNVLEYLDAPNAVLREVARLLRAPSGILSILVRNRAGEVLKAALLNGDFAATERNLTAEWTNESLYGGRVRLFSGDDLRTLMSSAKFTTTHERGIRVVSDYLPASISREKEYERIFGLEYMLGKRPEFAAIARYMHWMGRLDTAKARG